MKVMRARLFALLVLVGFSSAVSADTALPAGFGESTFDLERMYRAPLGAWLEYELRTRQSVLGTVRIALVRKSEGAFTVELATRGLLLKSQTEPTVIETDYVRDATGWRQKRRSSEATRAFGRSAGSSSSRTGMRQRSSAGRKKRSGSPAIC